MRLNPLNACCMQVNFHTTLSGQAMVTLLYHRQLDDTWKQAAGRLRAKLALAASCQPQHTPAIIGRSRKQKVELDCSFVLESLAVNGKPYVQKQIESAFSQPNAVVCQHMLSWAQRVTEGSQEGDLLGEAITSMHALDLLSSQHNSSCPASVSGPLQGWTQAP